MIWLGIHKITHYCQELIYHNLIFSIILIKATQPKGELDLVNLESLINVNDVNKRSGGRSKGNTNSLSISVTAPPPTSSSSGSSKGQRY